MTKIHPLALVDEANCSALFALYGAPEFLAAFLGALTDFLADLLGTLADVVRHRASCVARALGTVL